jgi:hypothetical protein
MREVLLAVAGRRRSPATLPGFHTGGRCPRTKGQRVAVGPLFLRCNRAASRARLVGRRGARAATSGSLAGRRATPIRRSPAPPPARG